MTVESWDLRRNMVMNGARRKHDSNYTSFLTIFDNATSIPLDDHTYVTLSAIWLLIIND